MEVNREEDQNSPPLGFSQVDENREDSEDDCSSSGNEREEVPSGSSGPVLLSTRSAEEAAETEVLAMAEPSSQAWVSIAPKGLKDWSFEARRDLRERGKFYLRGHPERLAEQTAELASHKSMCKNSSSHIPSKHQKKPS